MAPIAGLALAAISFLSVPHTLAAAITARDVSPTLSLGVATSLAPLSDPPTATPTLEPVLPPSSNPFNLTILSPTQQVQLFFGGVSSTPGQRKRSVPSYVLASTDFILDYPSVPLDHSSYVKNVACATDNNLSGEFTSTNVFNYAKSAWSGVSELILISSARSCGAQPRDNVYFVATSFAFNEAALSFTASGHMATPKEVVHGYKIEWGKVAPNLLRKRSVDGRIYPRTNSSLSETTPINCLLSDADGVEVDPDAPWDDAVLLESWSNQNGTESADAEGGDNGGNGGNLDLSLNLYCVHCGISGEISLGGSVRYEFIDLEGAEVFVQGNLYAGMYLGLDMKAEYTESYTYTFFNEPLDAWSIPLILDFGPYISVGLNAGLDIKAEGQLLIGASATWPDFDATLNLLDPSKSYSYGWTPVVDKAANASVDLAVTATLGLPMSLGVELDVLDGLFHYSAALVEEPGISATAEFQASADAGSGVTIGDGTCPGIAWEVNLENTVSVEVTDFDPYVLDDWQGDPLANGCITLSSSSASSVPSSSSAPTQAPSSSPAQVPSSTPATATATGTATATTTSKSRTTTRTHKSTSTTSSTSTSSTTSVSEHTTRTRKSTTSSTSTHSTKSTGQTTKSPTTIRHTGTKSTTAIPTITKKPTTTTKPPTTKPTTTKPTTTTTPGRSKSTTTTTKPKTTKSTASTKSATTTTTTTTKPTTTTHKPTSTPKAPVCVEPNPKTPFNSNCEETGCGLNVPTRAITEFTYETSSLNCAACCMANEKCNSFGWNAENGKCRLYSESFADLKTHIVNCGTARISSSSSSTGGAEHFFGNKACYKQVGCY